MMRFRHIALAVSAPLAIAALAAGSLSASAIAASDERAAKSERKSKAPAAKLAGEAESCISTSRIRQSRVHDDHTIDFEMTGGKIYRNELPHACSGLGFEKSFSYETSINRLCSTSIIRVLRTTGGYLDTGASCGLGTFQPVELIEDGDSAD